MCDQYQTHFIGHSEKKIAYKVFSQVLIRVSLHTDMCHVLGKTTSMTLMYNISTWMSVCLNAFLLSQIE